MKIIQIVVVDNHPIFLKGLSLILTEINGVSVVASCSSGKSFLHILKSVEPDIVFMDIKMPIMNGIEATKKALEVFPNIKVIGLTMFSDTKYMLMMQEAGAKGYLNKDVSKTELQKAIKAVLNEETYFPELAEQKDVELQDPELEESENVDELSIRELEVLQLLANGLATNEIAEKLFISPRTVERHRANLLSKTNTKNTAALVRYGIVNSLVKL